MALTPTTPDPAGNKKAELKAAQDEALLREVDEAVRQDQFANFGQRYGRPLIGVVIGGLVLFAGYLFWDSRQEAALEKDSEALVSAMDQIEAGNLKTGTDALGALATSDNDGARSAALVLQGGVLARQGNAVEAAKSFQRVASDPDAPQAYRDLALVREIALRYDTMQPGEVIARLAPLAKPDSAFFGSAGEMVAMAYLDQGKRKEAGVLFGQIARNDEVPQSLRSRARQMAGVLGVDAIEDVDAVLKETNADTSATSVDGN